MFTGAALFVTTTFDNFDENKPAWLAGVVVRIPLLIPKYAIILTSGLKGMISLMISSVTFGKLLKAYQLSHSRTLEQQKTIKFITTVGGVLGQAFVAAMQLAIAHSIPGSPSSPKWSSRMQLARKAAQIAA